MVGFVLPEGITGDAVFSEDGVYRHMLQRRRREDFKRILLWCGLNPSRANGTENDRTTKIESELTWRRKYGCYVKVNVCDYAATQPAAMLRAPAPRSGRNLAEIRKWANDRRTKAIVLVFGVFRPEIRHYMRETVELLKETEKPLLCIGANKDGSPRHPLYSPADVELIPWKEVLI